MDEFPITNLPQEILRDYFGEIPQPPKKLFIRGTFPIAPHYVFLTIVGSRKCSPYGQEVCRMLIQGLKGYPVVIVSGLAHGIDSCAHQSAIDSGLVTLAFPGSGLDKNVIYPRQNISLATTILVSGGCLLSEQPNDEPGASWTFPRRNRLMAGISRATLLIEASHQSGSRITAKLATEYNRDVFAVPGNIFDALSEAPHELIRLGAIPITSPTNLLEALGFSPETKTQLDLFPNLSDNEHKIMKFLNHPTRRGDLLRNLGIPVHLANELITQLEMKGLIQESYGEIKKI